MVDAPALGAGVRKNVEVQVLSPALQETIDVHERALNLLKGAFWRFDLCLQH